MLCYTKKSSPIIAAALIIAAVCLLIRLGPISESFSEEKRGNPLTMIIDAGHGGPDGGTTGRSGTVEKDINLKIALCVRDFADFFGIGYIMTRDTDISLHSGSADTIRKKKSEDLKNRLKLTLEQNNPVYIGIHQNYFNDFVSKGAQTFYSKLNPASEKLAEMVMESLKLYVDPENTRSAAVITKNNYLLNNLTCPAVIVECGFLSNPEEEMELCNPEYRQKLAFAITVSIFKTSAELFE